MRLRCSIPSYLRIASESLLILYENQSCTCRHCNRFGHIARECNSYACYNCDQLGHVASACTDYVRCSICKSIAHRVSSCPFAVIDDLNTNLPINAVLADAVATILVAPPAPSASASAAADEEEDHLIHAESLQHQHSSSSGHSTVLSSIPATPVFKFAKPTPVPTINLGAKVSFADVTRSLPRIVTHAKRPSQPKSSSPSQPKRSLPTVSTNKPPVTPASNTPVLFSSSTPAATDIIPSSVPDDDTQSTTSSASKRKKNDDDGFMCRRKKTIPAMPYHGRKST